MGITNLWCQHPDHTFSLKYFIQSQIFYSNKVHKLSLLNNQHLIAHINDWMVVHIFWRLLTLNSLYDQPYSNARNLQFHELTLQFLRRGKSNVSVMLILHISVTHQNVTPSNVCFSSKYTIKFVLLDNILRSLLVKKRF